MSQRVLIKICIMATLSLLVLNESRIAISQDIAHEHINVHELNMLSEKELSGILKAKFEQWVDVLSNIEVSSETRLYNCEYHDDKLGKRVDDSGWFQFRMLRLGRSYRIDSKWFVNQEATVPEAISQGNFDGEEGISRFFGNNVAVSGNFARIDVKHISVVTQNPVVYWLGGEFGKDQEFIFQSLLQSSNEWKMKVDVNEDVVEITHPYRVVYKDSPVGIRTVRCKVEKDIIPIELVTAYRDEEVKPGFWRNEKTLVRAEKRVGDLWMPSKIITYIRTSILGESVCAVQETEIKSAAFGKVSKPQLVVAFTPGTNVVDVTKGISYTIGKDEQAVGAVNPLYSPAKINPLPTTRSINNRFIQISLGVIIAILVILVIRKRWRMGCDVTGA